MLALVASIAGAQDSKKKEKLQKTVSRRCSLARAAPVAY